MNKKKDCRIPIVHLLLPSVLLGSKMLSYLQSNDDGMTTYEYCWGGERICG